MNLTRERYQQGSLTIERRNKGKTVWVYRWRETDASGRMTHRKQIVGTKEQYPTKSAAMKAADGLRLDINASAVSNSPLTVKQLIEHYTLIELADEANKTHRTKAVYKQHLDNHIVPKWGDERVGSIKAFAVEAWLKTFPHAPATKAKTRNILSAVYQHAVRYGWADRNPIREVRQSSKRLQEPDVLTPEEVPQPSRTIALIAATTGMRRGELFGLKWEDVNFEQRKVHIVRSIVDQVAGEPKTIGSKRPLPIPEQVVASLQEWRKAADYDGGDDWVFASEYSLGGPTMAEHRPSAAYQTRSREGRDNKERWMAYLPADICNLTRIVWGRAEDASGTHEALNPNGVAWHIRASRHFGQTSSTR